ncbi:MAG: RIP metalloprotease RseP [Parcubacteria group bacterium]|nr:RIP metalloprotease RseP [Parcubacteria group bacterium]
MLLGILSVIFFLSLLILIHESGHFLAAKFFKLKVEEFGFGFPPRIISKKKGETRYSLNWLPFGGFVKIYGENTLEQKPDNEADRGRDFSSQKAWKRTIVLLAGVFMNFIFGWLAISFVLAAGIPSALFISEVRPESPAAAAGLKPSDKIAAIYAGGESLTSPSVNSFVEFIQKYKGGEFKITVERSGKTLDITTASRVSPPQGEGALGIALLEAGSEPRPFLSAFGEGFKDALTIIKEIVFAFYGALAGIFTNGSLSGVAGPVGIVGVAAQAAGISVVYLLQLFGLISLNLAVLNILPFPALDGGRLFFVLIEKIKGSPVSAKTEGVAHAVGFSLLLALMAAITIKDVAGLF